MCGPIRITDCSKNVTDSAPVLSRHASLISQTEGRREKRRWVASVGRARPRHPAASRHQRSQLALLIRVGAAAAAWRRKSSAQSRCRCHYKLIVPAQSSYWGRVLRRFDTEPTVAETSTSTAVTDTTTRQYLIWHFIGG